MDEGNLEREMEREMLIITTLSVVMVGAAGDSTKTFLW